MHLIAYISKWTDIESNWIKIKSESNHKLVNLNLIRLDPGLNKTLRANQNPATSSRWRSRSWGVCVCVCVSPVDQAVVLPAVTHLQHKLLPQVSHGTHSSVVEVHHTDTQSQTGRQTVARSRLQLIIEMLLTGEQRQTWSNTGSESSEMRLIQRLT